MLRNFFQNQLFLFVALSLLNISTFAKTYTTTGSGNWNNAAFWDANGSPGTYWGASDVVIVNHDMNLNVNIGFAGSMTINASASITGNKDIALYNGASVSASGSVSIKKLTLNATSSFVHSEPLVLSNQLTVGSGSTLTCNNTVIVGGKFDNNGGIVIANYTFDVSGNLTNNNGTMTFNGPVTIDGDFDNNNSSAVVNINSTFNVSEDLENNSGAVINIGSSGVLISEEVENNSGSTINNEGRVEIEEFENNGGTVINNGVFDISEDFTQNGGTFTNNGGMIVGEDFTINGGGTVNGDGILRVDEITNYGTFNGSVDICRKDDSTPTTLNGGGSYNVSLSYCTEPSSAALPVELTLLKAHFISESTLEVIWQTESELNNDFFTIYYSIDGKKFMQAKSVEGAGTSNKTTNYKTIINDVKADLIYLKLAQKDFDGKSEEFPIIAVRKEKKLFSNTEQMSIYPNPGNGNSLKLQLSNFELGEYNCNILDYNGQIIISRQFTIDSESYLNDIELLKDINLSKGLYFIQLNTSTKNIVEKYLVY
ncbi:MAG: T9SS type A sorting domain-containing protein [Flavobacteriales bacterium]|nr:T9SS type A sorting domain-containing protein [Flavobacteriales bacterium]